MPTATAPHASAAKGAGGLSQSGASIARRTACTNEEAGRRRRNAVGDDFASHPRSVAALILGAFVWSAWPSPRRRSSGTPTPAAAARSPSRRRRRQGRRRRGPADRHRARRPPAVGHQRDRAGPLAGLGLAGRAGARRARTSAPDPQRQERADAARRPGGPDRHRRRGPGRLQRRAARGPAADRPAAGDRRPAPGCALLLAGALLRPRRRPRRLGRGLLEDPHLDRRLARRRRGRRPPCRCARPSASARPPAAGSAARPRRPPAPSSRRCR